MSGMSKALAAHNVCHKKLTKLNKEAFSEFNVELTRRVCLLEPRDARSRRTITISDLVHPCLVFE